MKKMGLEFDPDQYPQINYKDPDLADYYRHRTAADAAADFRDSQPHSDSEDEHYGTKDQATSSVAHVMNQARERGHKYSEKRYGKLPPGQEYRNRRSLRLQQRELERGMKEIGRGTDGDRDWYELMRDPSVRGRDVSERLYAQHRHQLEDHLYRAEPRRRAEKAAAERKPAPAGDGEDGAGGGGPDERQDAKFEGAYEEGKGGGSEDGRKNRKNRDRK